MDPMGLPGRLVGNEKVIVDIQVGCRGLFMLLNHGEDAQAKRQKGKGAADHITLCLQTLPCYPESGE